MGLDETHEMGNSIHAFLKSDTAVLADSLGVGWSEARLDLRILLGHVLGKDKAWLIANEHCALPEHAVQHYKQLLARRLEGQPIAYLTGKREFYGRVFHVGPEVLIPRPESELLIDLAKSLSTKTSEVKVLDLGAGSGCLAITLALELPGSEVTSIEISAGSLVVARKNALELGAKVTWKLGNWFSDLQGQHFDLIVSNPPYVAENDPHLDSGDVRFEPRQALVSGAMGLDDIQRIVSHASGFLANGGWLLVEHGWDQGEAVRNLMFGRGYRNVHTQVDMSGNERVTLGSVG